jgi:hypothetical protein
MLAHAPLAIPQGTQLRGPSGSLRCSICRGYTSPAAHKLATLRHREHLFPSSPALLARSDGMVCTVQWRWFFGYGLRHQVLALWVGGWFGYWVLLNLCWPGWNPAFHNPALLLLGVQRWCEAGMAGKVGFCVGQRANSQ